MAINGFGEEKKQVNLSNNKIKKQTYKLLLEPGIEPGTENSCYMHILV